MVDRLFEQPVGHCNVVVELLPLLQVASKQYMATLDIGGLGKVGGAMTYEWKAYMASRL